MSQIEVQTNPVEIIPGQQESGESVLLESERMPLVPEEDCRIDGIVRDPSGDFFEWIDEKPGGPDCNDFSNEVFRDERVPQVPVKKF